MGNERWAFICELRTITPSLRDPTPTDSHSPPATQPQLPIEPSQTTPTPQKQGNTLVLVIHPMRYIPCTLQP